jgi:peptidoglycan hydrolase-like protein with peptidoglycan-binding domain/succinate dehydrogenase/fumarate reductase cytochrome b subunit
MKTSNLKNIFNITILIITAFIIEINNSFAQSDNGLQGSLNFKEAANNITENVLTSATTLLMTAGFVLFFWGVVRFLYDRSNGDDSKLAKDKEAMLWGLGALFVMVSVWGIIKLFQSFLGIENDNNIKIKPVQFAPPASSSNNSGDPDPEGDLDAWRREQDKSFDKDKAENPFANTDFYPIIKIGSKSDLAAGISADGKAFSLLYGLLSRKKCDSTIFNGQTVDLDNTFGGTYDEKHSGFVKDFQRKNGLKADGIVGKDTWEALSVQTGMKTRFTEIVVKDCK